ncbi:MAG: hypothetical protein E7294_11485 [Lachnospiraceae bacterium]|nr:hypothetical protein [Lachnospiraceae bacterium]
MLQLLYMLPKKRMLALLLVITMLFTLCPATVLYAEEAELEVGLNGLSVKADSTDFWKYSDGTIDGTIKSTVGNMGCTGLPDFFMTRTTRLTFTNTSDMYGELSFDYSTQLRGGSVTIENVDDIAESGSVSEILPAGSSIEIVLKSTDRNNTDVTAISIKNISYSTNKTGVIFCKKAAHGSYVISDTQIKRDRYVSGKASEIITITPVPHEGFAVKTITVSDSDDQPVTVSDHSFTMPDKTVTVTVEFEPDQADFEVEGDTYTIKTAAGWKAFCECLEDTSYKQFAGKTVTLSQDINEIDRSAGTRDMPFQGIFDGNGKTLTVNIKDTGKEGTALFRAISDGAVIRNINVEGTITGGTHVAGLVGFSDKGDAEHPNTIQNCRVSTGVSVPSQFEGNKHMGGVVGHGLTSYLKIEDTVFDGEMYHEGDYAGGLQGWSDGNHLTLHNCLFSGKYTGTNREKFHPVALHDYGSNTVAESQNVYYSTIPLLSDAGPLAVSGEQVFAEAPFGFETKQVTAADESAYYMIMGDGSFVIKNEEDWKSFANSVNDGISYEGKTIKLEEDIAVDTPVGISESRFMGDFDGDGHVLKVALTAKENVCAPFRYVENAAFKDLIIQGSVSAKGYQYAAGLVGEAKGNVRIENCRNDATIVSDRDGKGGHGGYAAKIPEDTEIDFTGCLFGGKLLTTTATNSCGGFVGYNEGSVSANDCLFAPEDAFENEKWAVSENSCTFVAGKKSAETVKITDSYYKKPFGMLQGAGSRLIGTDEYVTFLPAEDVIKTYPVSGIRVYQKGMMCEDTFYYKDREESVSDNSLNITLSYDRLPENKLFEEYAVSEGSLKKNDTDSFCLELTDGNVTIMAVLKDKPTAERIISPTASAITFGDTLADSSISGGSFIYGDEKVAGICQWMDDTIKPEVADSNVKQYEAVFIPDKDEYAKIYFNIPVTVNKAELVVSAPDAQTGLLYNGEKQELVGSGSADHGTMYYAVTKAKEQAPEFDGLSGKEDKKWSTSVPKAKDAGDYTVWYKCLGDANHNDTAVAFVTGITIGPGEEIRNMPKASISAAFQCTKVSEVELPADWEWSEEDKNKTLNSGEELAVTAVYNGEDKDFYSEQARTMTIKLTRSECTHPADRTEERYETEPGCTKSGHKGIYCMDCQAWLRDGGEVEALGHDYETPVYVWSEDGKSCTATAVCKRQGCTEKEEGHTITEQAVVTSAVKEDSTTTKKGTTTYTATFHDQPFTVQTKDVEDIEKKKETGENGPAEVKEQKAAAKDTILYAENIKADVIVTSEPGKEPEVKYLKLKDTSLKTIEVPSVVTINGVTYEVTEIAAGAFKDNKSLTKIIIPKSTKRIGKYAFKGYKKLRTIIVKTTKLTQKTVAGKAFSGVGKKVKIKVPGKKKKAYIKLFRKKGLSKKVKIRS